MNEMALNTKTRALLSEHFTVDDYYRFESIKTLSGLLNAYEENKRYREVTYNLHNHEFHRDELEEDIRLIIPREYKKLKRYLKTQEVDPYLISIEAELVINKLYSLKYNTPFVIYRHYVELSEYLPYSLQTLQSIRSLNDFRHLLRGSVFSKYLMNYEEPESFWKSELKLFVYEYSYLLEAISKKQKDLRTLVSRTFLFETLMLIESLNRLKVEDTQYFLNLLPQYIDALNKNELRNMLAGGHYQKEILNYLKAPASLDTIEEAAMRIKYQMFMKTIRYGKSSSAILYAYLGLDEIETKILIRIIESTRYQHESDYIYEAIFEEGSG